jgi:rfaE bifunctional protein kinase chain/domain
VTPEQIMTALPNLSALVVGDVCLDRWCTYDPATAEPSRETGIPRIGVVASEVTAGAAGTVANNLAALGVGRVAVLGAIGHDGFGLELSRALGAREISSDLCVRSKELQTFTYTKLINAQTGVEDQPRIDFINTAPLAPDVESRLLDNLQMSVDSYSAILISDQAETNQGGVITPAVRELLGELASVYQDRVFFADSRRRIHLFRRVIVKPNQQEAEAACRELFGRVDYGELLSRVESRLMIVTHGGDGAAIVRPDGQSWVAAGKVEYPVDICGAGDSFSAGCAMALAAGASPEDAARFGNLVASVTIMKKGTGTASPQEVLAAHEHARD